MNKNFNSFLWFFLSLLILTTSHAIAGPGKPFNQIIFFGDSLSDTGNLYNYDLYYMPKSPPYYEGRFSNRLLWTDLVGGELSEQYGVDNDNYAFGGETAIFHNPANGFLPYSLTMSRNSYLLRTAYQDRSQTLFIIWIGANDYLHDSFDIDGLSTEVVDSIKATIESLIYHGGMNFLILNLPDIGKSPFATQYGYGEILTQFINKHNEKIEKVVSDLQNEYKSININLYDVHSLFEDLQKNVSYYNKKYKVNITNLTESCWQGGYTLLRKQGVTEADIAADLDAYIKNQARVKGLTTEANPVAVDGLANYIATSPDLREAYTVTKSVQNNTAQLCNNPDNYVFWDRIHPTRVIHLMFADGIMKYIQRHYDIVDSR